MCATGATGSGNNLLDGLKQKLDREPDNPALHRRFAAACFLYGRTSEAIEHLRLAVELSGHEPDYLLSLAEALLDTGYPEEALPLFKQAAPRLEGGTLRRTNAGLETAAFEAPLMTRMLELEAASKPPITHLISGTLLVLRGQRREASDEYLKAVETDETSALAAENIAFLWSVERNNGGADVRIQDLLRAAKASDHSYRMDLYLADAYAHSGILENAARHLAAALRAEQRYLPSYTQAATLLRQMELRESTGAGSLREEIDAALGSLETRSAPLALLARGRVARRKNGAALLKAVQETLGSDDSFVRLMGAIEVSDSLSAEEADALATGTDLGESHLAGLVRARLLLETQGVQAAAEEAERTLEAHPDRAEAAHAVAYFWGLRRRLKTAEAMLEAAEGPESMEPARFLEVGMTFVEAGRPSEAITLCEGLSHPQAAVVHARALARLGRAEDALSLLQQVSVEMAEPPRELRRELARLYFVLGRDEDALDLLSGKA